MNVLRKENSPKGLRGRFVTIHIYQKEMTSLPAHLIITRVSTC